MIPCICFVAHSLLPFFFSRCTWVGQLSCWLAEVGCFCSLFAIVLFFTIGDAMSGITLTCGLCGGAAISVERFGCSNMKDSSAERRGLRGRAGLHGMMFVCRMEGKAQVGWACLGLFSNLVRATAIDMRWPCLGGGEPWTTVQHVMGWQKACMPFRSQR